MFLFYVLSFFKKGDTIQGGTLYKGGHYLRKYGISEGYRGISKYFFLDHFSPSFQAKNGFKSLEEFFVYCLALKTYSGKVQI